MKETTLSLGKNQVNKKSIVFGVATVAEVVPHGSIVLK